MEGRYKLFDEVLKALHEAGALSGLVLIGSWCQHVFKKTGEDTEFIPALITSDVDFLITQAHKIDKEIDVPQILEKLGFEMIASPVSNYMKYSHKELEVEFLIHEKGRGFDAPRPVKELHVTAQSLRYLSMLQENTEVVNYKGIPLRIVQMEAYILNKFLISGKRQRPEKKDKDITTAVQLGEYLAMHGDSIEKMKNILDSLHPKWKRDILSSMKGASNILFSLLSN